MLYEVITLKDVDCSYSVPGVGRFRVNLCSQRGSISAVLRSIADQIPSFEQLGLPPVLEQIAMEERGLVLVITSYSIHYTKLYDRRCARRRPR